MQRHRLRLPVTFAEWLTFAIVGMGVLWLGMQVWGLRGPRHQGRTAREWVDRLTEHSRSWRGSDANDASFYRARTALWEMGPEAYGALVEAGLSDIHDSPLRRFVRPLVGAFGGRVGYPGERFGVVQEFFRDASPPARELVPLFEAALKSGGEPGAAALVLIGSCHDDDGAESARWERRRQSGGDGFPSRVCDDVLIQLRPISEAGLAAAVRRIHEVAQLGHADDWHAFYTVALSGDRARVVIPELAPFLGGQGPGWRSVPLAMAAGVTLLEIDPEHPQAVSWMRGRPWFPAFDHWNQVTNAHVASLVNVLSPLRTVRSATTLRVLEEISRDQVAGWETRGLASSPVHLLERFAPARAKLLFEGQMTATNKVNVRLVAAGAVLRVDGLDTNAVGVIAPSLRDDSGLSGMAAEQLMYAAEANPALAPVLTEALARSMRLTRVWESLGPRREHLRLVAVRGGAVGRGGP